MYFFVGPMDSVQPLEHLFYVCTVLLYIRLCVAQNDTHTHRIQKAACAQHCFYVVAALFAGNAA